MTNSEMKAAAQANLDRINEQLEIYKVANRVANTSFVILATDEDREHACLTKQDGGYNFGGGPSGAVVFDNLENAEKAAKNCADLFDSEHIKPFVIGLGCAYRRKFDALLEMRAVMKKTIESIGE